MLLNALLALSAGPAGFAADHFVSTSGANVPPFGDWATAAKNIQDAIDASTAGDIVWVTNGIYATGGKVAGNLATRVAVDKAITVQSVNGAAVTTIQGAWDPATNGPLAVRCVWMTNNSLLSGFTLRGGATWGFSGSPAGLQQDGGGVAASANAKILNCLITGNAAAVAGGGAYGGELSNCVMIRNFSLGRSAGPSSEGLGGGAAYSTLRNCVVSTNSAFNYGGGVYSCDVRNSAITRNTAPAGGGGAAFGKLLNCTITGNQTGSRSLSISGSGGGVYHASLTNCVIFANQAGNYTDSSNHLSCTFGFSCTSPLPSGTGNLSVDPQLLEDDLHLAMSSPCRAAGTSTVLTGTDLDGQAWTNAPAIGCDEWWPGPLIAAQPQAQLSSQSSNLRVKAIGAGQEPLTFFWYHRGVLLDPNSNHSGTLVVSNFTPGDAGAYQVVLSNSFGTATSAVIQVVFHCVDSASGSPAPPYADWTSAAQNIQDAIDLATEGDFVLVTNGLYSTGGRVMGGDLTNRVALTKALAVVSINGPSVTTVRGFRDPATTNGPMAVRCAWMAAGATLDGFTLTEGATRASSTYPLGSGGGVLAASTDTHVANCVISNNSSYFVGGGSYRTFLDRCSIIKNTSQSGGGDSESLLLSCVVRSNSAQQYGGGAYYSTLVNCAVTGNGCGFSSDGGGTYAGTVFNSIVYGNHTGLSFTSDPYPNWGFGDLGVYAYCCTTPAHSGAGNITTAPQMLDSAHLSAFSPCRGVGSSAYVSGTDIDGESWANPPSIGCDEYLEAGLTGPLSVSLNISPSPIAETRYTGLFGTFTGRASRVAWDFGDGSFLTNMIALNTVHAWSPGDYLVTFTAYNTDHPGGVSTVVPVSVLALLPPRLDVGGFTNQQFNLSFPGLPGVLYAVEQTTNLSPPIAWTRVATIYSPSTNTLQAVDAAATNAQRFYRVRSY